MNGVYGKILSVIMGMGLLMSLMSAGCADFYFNNTSSLGGDTPGLRGDVEVAFVNNTPYRALFTYGTYDPLNLDQNQFFAFPVQFEQFSLDDNARYRLERNSTSNTFTFACGRAMALGTETLAELIEDNDIRETTSGAPVYTQFLRPVVGSDGEQDIAGIAFTDRALDDPDAGASIVAWAEPVVTLQGAEYQCESRIIYTFEQDDTQPGGIRVDIEVILP